MPIDVSMAVIHPLHHATGVFRSNRSATASKESPQPDLWFGIEVRSVPWSRGGRWAE